MVNRILLLKGMAPITGEIDYVKPPEAAGKGHIMFEVSAEIKRTFGKESRRKWKE